MEEEKAQYTINEKDDIGEIQIADEVVASIAGLAAAEVEGVDSLAGNMSKEIAGKLGMKNTSRGVRVDVTDKNVSVSVSLNLKYGYSIPDISEQVQNKVKSAIENMTGLNVTVVNIKIAGIISEE